MHRYAHSLPGRPPEEWEPLAGHLAAVGERAAGFAAPFDWSGMARMAGRLHDIGKCSEEFQNHILRTVAGEDHARGPDHSTAGAREAVRAYPGPLGRILAFIIAGHHAGLGDGVDLDARLTKELPRYEGWEAHAGALARANGLAPTRRGTGSAATGFAEAFLIRMLFSCLVDADFLETERFYAGTEGDSVGRSRYLDLETLRFRLRAHMAAKQAEAREKAAGRLNALRAEVLDHAVAKAAMPPGLFTLTVPTGGGKTLASLSFALEHAVKHRLRRVVYVIPFTSIIEQTAEVFRKALGPDADHPNETDILEHHASYDWETAAKALRDDGRGTEPLDRLRRAAENWDTPIVVTTAVQFFESLFANRTSRCRKLHNLAQSVIVLDEAQTLPLRILRPCLAALDELARNYGASILICTATQPAWREIDGALVVKKPNGSEDAFGLDIPEGRELAPDPERLYAELKRVEVERLPEPIGDDVIAARFAEQDQMLCIVNTRPHAQALFELIRHLPGAIHLTTLMCPRHRRMMLEEARMRLKARQPVRIVSTSLIEAGVDIDVPEVWRAPAGLDSIAQAAGRCNREFSIGSGRVVVFEPVNRMPPRDVEAFWQAARPVLRASADPLSLEAVKAYFGELYFQKGPEAVDSVAVEGRLGILPAISERADSLAFPFKSIAEAFHVIEEAMEPAVVPWNEDAEAILNRIERMDRPLGGDLRRLQQYTVSIPPKERERWLSQGVLRPVHPALGEALLRFADLAHYDERTGVRLSEPTQRSAESNVFS